VAVFAEVVDVSRCDASAGSVSVGRRPTLRAEVEQSAVAPHAESTCCDWQIAMVATKFCKSPQYSGSSRIGGTL